jgi:hypothetical protein
MLRFVPFVHAGSSIAPTLRLSPNGDLDERAFSGWGGAERVAGGATRDDSARTDCVPLDRAVPDHLAHNESATVVTASRAIIKSTPSSSRSSSAGQHFTTCQERFPPAASSHSDAGTSAINPMCTPSATGEPHAMSPAAHSAPSVTAPPPAICAAAARPLVVQFASLFKPSPSPGDTPAPGGSDAIGRWGAAPIPLVTPASTPAQHRRGGAPTPLTATAVAPMLEAVSDALPAAVSSGNVALEASAPTPAVPLLSTMTSRTLMATVEPLDVETPRPANPTDPLSRSSSGGCARPRCMNDPLCRTLSMSQNDDNSAPVLNPLFIANHGDDISYASFGNTAATSPRSCHTVDSSRDGPKGVTSCGGSSPLACTAAAVNAGGSSAGHLGQKMAGRRGTSARTAPVATATQSARPVAQRLRQGASGPSAVRPTWGEDGVSNLVAEVAWRDGLRNHPAPEQPPAAHLRTKDTTKDAASEAVAKDGIVRRAAVRGYRSPNRQASIGAAPCGEEAKAAASSKTVTSYWALRRARLKDLSVNDSSEPSQGPRRPRR